MEGHSRVSEDSMSPPPDYRVSRLHRSVRDRILLPRRTEGQGQDPRSDLSRAHGRRHRPLRGRFHPDGQEARRRPLSGAAVIQIPGRVQPPRRESLNAGARFRRVVPPVTRDL